MTALPTTPCRGCGKPIVFADIKRADGAPGKVPLDPKGVCYVPRGMFGTITAERVEGAMVSHFATCRDASKFSSKPGQPSAQDEIDDLRKRLQAALDRVAVLESEIRIDPRHSG